MEPDQILEELWKVKEKLSQESDNDPQKFVANLRRWEAANVKGMSDVQPVQRST
jgi:hypothetical protein